jgi:biopolymer transport protein ExbD
VPSSTWEEIQTLNQSNDMGGSVGSEDANLGFQIAPMVDVVFVLMLFFMATTGSQVKEMHLNITTPSGQPAAALSGTPKTDIVVDIAANGAVLILDRQVADGNDEVLETFVTELKQLLQVGPEDRVVIRPALASKHKRVMDVLSRCVSAKV